MNKWILTSLIVLCFSCSSDNDDNPQPNPFGEIDPAFVGTWEGEIDGSLGTSEVTFSIKDNGTMTSAGPSDSPYCPYSGKWGVKNGQFKSEGTDSCFGSKITMTAVLSGNMLDGSWVASSGNSGSFTIQKQ